MKNFRNLSLAMLPIIAGCPAGARAQAVRIATEASDPPSFNIPRSVFIANMTSEFQKLDANGDGAVVRAEIEMAQRRAQAAAAIAQAKILFARIDRDHDGQITLDEFLRWASEAPAKVDAAPILQRFDTDYDGTISLVEYRTATLANFDRMDTDKDGDVSVEEQRAAGIIK